MLLSPPPAFWGFLCCLFSFPPSLPPSGQHLPESKLLSKLFHLKSEIPVPSLSTVSSSFFPCQAYLKGCPHFLPLLPQLAPSKFSLLCALESTSTTPLTQL